MQARMKKYPLSEEKIHALLTAEPVARLASTGSDGFPYITYMDEKIFIHGLAAGEKLANIKKDSRVGFEVERMIGLVHHAQEACDTNTAYESVIIRGHAAIIADDAAKRAVLDAFVRKYAPQHAGGSYPDAMVKMTGIIELSIQSCTGKYYPL